MGSYRFRPAMQRLLFVDHSPALGGAERSLLLLFEELDRTRFEPHLATQPGALARAARERKVPVHELPLPRLRWTPAALWRLPRGALQLAAIARREGVHLIHANTLRAAVYSAGAARATALPWVWHVRDLLGRGLSARLLARASRTRVAVSEIAARRLSAPARILPNGVRLSDFRAPGSEARRALRSQWRVPPDVPLVGQVARFAPWKGQHRFLEAAAAVLRDHPEARFVLVGGDIFGTQAAYARRLRERAARGALAGRVVFAGWREDIPAVLAALDVLVHASRDEPFGRILIEAAASAVPVVADASGASQEIVRHNRTGLLVAAGDSAALASGVRRLLSDPTLARNLGDEARELAAQRHDAAAVARSMEEIFSEALRAPRPGAGYLRRG